MDFHLIISIATIFFQIASLAGLIYILSYMRYKNKKSFDCTVTKWTNPSTMQAGVIHMTPERDKDIADKIGLTQWTNDNE